MAVPPPQADHGVAVVLPLRTAGRRLVRRALVVLPLGPQAVGVGVVQEEHRVVGGTQRKHVPADPLVHPVVDVRPDPAFEVVAEAGITRPVPRRRVVRGGQEAVGDDVLRGRQAADVDAEFPGEVIRPDVDPEALPLALRTGELPGRHHSVARTSVSAHEDVVPDRRVLGVVDRPVPVRQGDGGVDILQVPFESPPEFPVPGEEARAAVAVVGDLGVLGDVVVVYARFLEFQHRLDVLGFLRAAHHGLIPADESHGRSLVVLPGRPAGSSCLAGLPDRPAVRVLACASRTPASESTPLAHTAPGKPAVASGPWRG